MTREERGHPEWSELFVEVVDAESYAEDKSSRPFEVCRSALGSKIFIVGHTGEYPLVTMEDTE